ncbi:acetyl/propionyl/methylcrotonyl-CoA carboxylase subunit alpha [Thalassolituus pacificus]|uniref:Biotin carboxylase n=1 Tax=Thalassolituus pacificus TaxID=2975440 RepID=A0A9X3AH73_9GAMM|nr:acetyl/propionyl/methylcrotonyl-CoA carboxylase subunit alpha [Thalassolituus pacificus]MCT7359176.1 acetyl/propionyl/methylcrotonyl-CoA carboxylase subunit alpha [Thalassolituus pacificus]
MTEHLFNKILIANRGEIAVRVMRTAKALGIRTVAIYSDADASALHVQQADEAIALGGVTAAESYLDMHKVLDAARATGAEAIHPGYGFLSENAAFARACEDAGIAFIGPSAAAIEAMGDKASAKALLADSGVPLVPGYHGDEQSDERLSTEAERIGYPLLLKASAGGGGKGMRIVLSAATLHDDIAAARREARSAFGDDRLLIEKYLIRPRHVEVQVFMDSFGNGVYLFERDCSVQRRHQKVIEEAPAPGMTAALRQRMGEAALAVAQRIQYRGAGTVEFLLDANHEFFFMEMNTRLQVEHPVTEMITGVDLVYWQLRVAAGKGLPQDVSQQSLPINGHAIEVRLYAEDPDNHFLPAIGRLNLWQAPELSASVRLDSGVQQGDDVSPYYDPMLAKLIAHGRDRTEALHNLRTALAALQVDGVKTNRDFLLRLLSLEAFANAELSTDFIERNQHELTQPLPTHWELAALTELLLPTLASQSQPQPQQQAHDPWHADGFQSALPAQRVLRLESAVGDVLRARARANEQAHGPDRNQGWHLQLADRSVQLQGRLELKSQAGDTRLLQLDARVNGQQQSLPLALREHDLLLFLPEGSQRFVRNRWLGEQAQDDHGGLTAPMAGQVLEVKVQPGEQVQAGQVLMIMEAMKMEHSIRAPEAALVQAVLYQAGDQVAEGTELLQLEITAEAENAAEADA